MKVTRLQGKLNSYYENSKANLGENSEYLEQITKIAGNRGLSHKERINRINNWTNHLEGSLNDSENIYIDQLLRINNNYVKTTSRIREIKDLYKVREGIVSLRRNIRANNLERSVESNESPLPAETIKLDDYRQNSQGNDERVSYLKKTGNALIKGLVTAGVATAITVFGIVSNYLGKESQQPQIKQKQETINSQEKKIIVYEKLIENKDNQIAEQKTAIVVAGRPDAEVVEETTNILSAQYEKVIQSTKQEAEKQVNELINEIRNEPVIQLHADCLDSYFHPHALSLFLNLKDTNNTEKMKSIAKEIFNKAKVNDETVTKFYVEVYTSAKSYSYREKGLHSIISNAGKSVVNAGKGLGRAVGWAGSYIGNAGKGLVKPKEKQEKKTESSPVVLSSVVVVDSNSSQEGAWGRDKQKYLQTNIEDSTIVSPAVNVTWENRMAVVGENFLEPSTLEKDCECSTIGFERQQYLKDEFMDYPKRIGKKRRELDKKGNHLGAALSSVGWILASANDVVEFKVVRPATGVIGGVWGTGSRAIGNKWDGFSNGWENGNNFGAFAMDGVFGGQSKNSFDSYLLQGKVGKAVKVPYCMEDTKLGGHVKLGEIVFVDSLPWIWNNLFGHHHGHNHAGGFERDGGEVIEGAGRAGGVIK